MSELKSLIAKGEGVHLDFKFRIDDQRKIARTLAAFANTDGGTLLIGVKDNGKIAGVNPEEEFYMIDGAADLYTFPPVKVNSVILNEGHHFVLKIDVEASENRHLAIDENGKKAYYYRLDDHTIRGNKVLDRVWVAKHKGIERSERFSEEEQELLKILRENDSMSISKIFKVSKLNRNNLERFIASLIVWGIVKIVIEESGIKYQLVE